MKCKLGLCSSNQACAPHRWTYNHEDWWVLVRTTAIMTVVVVLILFAMEANWEAGQLIRDNIAGFNCGQLEEYIADRASQYSYAVHRHKWLC